GHDARS
ncbi:hypothetical protein D043_1305B, partial [Vibrio parahaemolyticus EKP-021]